ncbi:hypothetical protein NQP46_30005 [Streptomyces albus]|nr:hypothetical protein NQP46_30005 [Streptomyces albus]
MKATRRERRAGPDDEHGTAPLRVTPRTRVRQGRVFGSLEEGGAHVEGIGFGEITERRVRAAGQLPGDAFYAGFPSARSPSRSSRGPGRTPGARSRSTPASPARSSAPPGRRAYRCGSTA